LQGYNDIATTNPNEIKLFKNKSDIYKYGSGSAKKVLMVCPLCGTIRLKQINQYFSNKRLACICDDDISFSEKCIYSMLKQLKIQFEYHKSFIWSQRKIYDFYIPSLNILLELNGIQHYKESSRGRSLIEEQNNDKLKETLAKKK
jgi:hypothetical protein